MMSILMTNAFFFIWLLLLFSFCFNLDFKIVMFFSGYGTKLRNMRRVCSRGFFPFPSHISYFIYVRTAHYVEADLWWVVVVIHNNILFEAETLQMPSMVS